MNSRQVGEHDPSLVLGAIAPFLLSFGEKRPGFTQKSRNLRLDAPRRALRGLSLFSSALSLQIIFRSRAGLG